MNINIQVIPESEMRKEVNGADWFFDEKGDLQVRVSPMSDWRRETLLAMHEAFEGILCKYKGIDVKDVDAFDNEYDKTHTFDTDAGDEPEAPYCRQHCFATAVERILCAELDVNWKDYDKELRDSYPGPSKK
jgi:hypothetical protein